MNVIVIGGPMDGASLTVPDGALSVFIPLRRGLDALDMLGPVDPVPSPDLVIAELPIYGGRAWWDERK